MKTKIAIIDYGVGNVGSVMNAFKNITQNVQIDIQNDASKLQEYDKLFLPGVGAYSYAMNKLQMCGMDIAIKDFVKSGKYIIGMCLGMQIMFDSSDEFGTCKGLGLVEGKVVAFDKTKFDTKTKIPHMGWNTINNKQDDIFKTQDKFIQNPYLYFVHSYHVKCDNKYVLATSNYGYEFVSAIKKDNVYGFQPHLEKSSNIGLEILNNFVNLK